MSPLFLEVPGNSMTGSITNTQQLELFLTIVLIIYFLNLEKNRPRDSKDDKRSDNCDDMDDK